jgi:hypothetical protein
MWVAGQLDNFRVEDLSRKGWKVETSLAAKRAASTTLGADGRCGWAPSRGGDQADVGRERPVNLPSEPVAGPRRLE